MGSVYYSMWYLVSHCSTCFYNEGGGEEEQLLKSVPIICCKVLELSEPISPEVNHLIAEKRVSGTESKRLGTEKTTYGI